MPFVANPNGAEQRKLRRQLEAHHKRGDGITERIWSNLGNSDRHLRYAARIAVEHQPVDTWQRRALAEKEPRALINAMVALARQGSKPLQPRMVEALGTVSWSELEVSSQLELLRAYGLTLARLGAPAPPTRQALLHALDGHYPAQDVRLNREPRYHFL